MIRRTIYYPVGDNPPKARLIYGVDAHQGLGYLGDDTVHTVCTSPPYFGLRDYGTGSAQIGLEDTVEEYIDSLVSVFQEVKRVLRSDGTLWINLGDSYNGSGGSGGDYNEGGLRAGQAKYKGRKLKGLKPKDLIGVPWRVALALQADGWYLRNEIIWSKSNPMPESVRDRLTRSHEHIFLFAHPDSDGKYYYDIEAIKEPSVTGELFHGGYDALMPNGKKGHSRNGRHENADNTTTTRNKRTVWNVNPSSFKGAHFATWPTELVEPMVLAGCPKGGQVLDPFSGSGATGQVALSLGRNYVGIDLNEDYFPLAECRVQGTQATKPKYEAPEITTLDMFGVDT